MIRACVILLLALCIAAAGCSTPAPQPQQGTGTIQVSSVPAGAEVRIDTVYQGRTPAFISGVPAGLHSVGVQMDGYEPETFPVTVPSGGNATVSARLAGLPGTPPVTFVSPAATREGAPVIRVEGYWTYPPGRGSTENPVPILVHTEAFNTGSAGAREVQVSADFTYAGREICWNRVFLGTLAAGGHVSTDTMVSCPLPSPMNNADLEVRFGNIVVTQ